MSNTAAAEGTIKAQIVELKVVEPETNGELAEIVHSECAYCGKRMELHAEVAKLHERLNEREFYCDFCLRHKFYTKHSRHVLMLTFRAIIAYYYYAYYRAHFGSRRMYWSEIQEYVQTHMRVGLQNPVFFYDPDTYVWFVDFSRVGKGKGKVRLEDVLKTICNILICFNIPLHMNNVRMFEIYDKYREAIDKFYSQRNRPTGKKLLVPTLSGCGVYENHQNFNIDDTRAFTAAHCVRKDG